MQLESILSVAVLLGLGAYGFKHLNGELKSINEKLQTFKDSMPERYTANREFLYWVGEIRESVKRVHDRIDKVERNDA